MSVNLDQSKKIVLTPVITTSKVPILILITGYCYKKIPQKCIPPILSLLVEMIENEPDKQETEIVRLFFPSLMEILKSTDSSVRLFFESSSNVDVENIENYIKTIHHYLLEQMWKLESYDDFYSFLVSTSTLLVDPKPEITNSIQHLPSFNKPSKRLYSSSFLGDFVSIISLGVSSLNFEEGLQIWKGFIQYREESESFWASLNNTENNPINNKNSFFKDQILPNAYITQDLSKTQLYSYMDLASLFQSQVSILQKTSAPLSKSLIELLGSLSQSDRSLLPSSYHVEYLDSWRKADYDESFNSLHRYFDYMMSNRKQYFYHYALLALATLHSSFGANKEALRAIDEAILVARENKDLDCLNYLLTWLLNFMITKPHSLLNSKDHPSRSEILNFLRLKTKETGNLSLQAISFQFEVIVGLLEGFNLTSIMENMVKLFYLILNFEDTDELKGIFITACQVSDSIWKRIGYPSIGNLYLETAIDFAMEKSNEFDLILLYIRKASDLFFAGQIDESFKLLLSVEKAALKDISMSKKWKMSHDLMLFHLYLNKCNYSQCSILLERMLALAENVEEQEITNELIYERAIYNLKVNNVDESFDIISSQLLLMKENTLLYNNHWFIRFQVLYCQIFVEYTSYPERGLSILLNAANLSHKSSLIFNLCECILCLCKLLLKVDPIKSLSNVKELLFEFLPKILEMRKLSMVSDAYYLCAKIKFIETNQRINESSSEQHNEAIDCLLKYINISIDGYEIMFDFMKLKEILLFQKQVAQSYSLQTLLTESEIKLERLEMKIFSERNSPIL